MSADPPVVVIGAGLAGLACATTLQANRVPVRVLEAGDGVGGRMRTDVLDGFTLDRGFQVINTAYPALRRTVDLSDLDLRTLPRGVRVRRDGVLHAVPHPLASPTAPFRALASGAAGPRGKLALARYVGALLAPSPSTIKARPDLPAEQAWSESFSREVIDGVLVPFLSGVVLEDTIGTSRVFADLMMRMFALGSSAVPARGMHALPQLLASRLPAGSLQLSAPVAGVEPFVVTMADGTEVPASAVVVATDPWTAYGLVPDLGEPPQARGVTTHYFSAAPWAGLDGTLVVDADPSGIANSVVLSASAPEYAPRGRALIATSVVHGSRGAALTPDEVGRAAVELHQAPGAWEHLASRDIPQALPAMTAPHPLRKPVYQASAGVWVAGDHRDTSSIQGALVSGSRTAAAVLQQVSRGRAVL